MKSMIFDPVNRGHHLVNVAHFTLPAEHHSPTGRPVYCHHEQTIKY